jgi:protein-disulfide isomerase
MTDEGRPGQRDWRQSPLSEADLDADLWSESDYPGSAFEDAEAGLGAVSAPDAPVPEPAARPDLPTELLDPLVPAGGDLAGPARRARTVTRVRKEAKPARPARQVSTVRAQKAAKPSRMPARDRLLRERERRGRRRRRFRGLAVCAGLAVLIAVGAVGVRVFGPGTPDAKIVKVGSGYRGPYAPVTVNADGSVTMAQPGVTKPVLGVYEDFQCPPCRSFEKANGGVIEELAAQGKIKVVYYLFTIFSAQPGQANSTRAWAAAKCAPAGDWVAYHNALFASQPPLTRAGGFPVSQLTRLGRDVGIKGPGFAACVQSQRYSGQDARTSDRILSDGPDGLPTLSLNGQLLTFNPTSGALRQKLILASS